MRVLCVAEKPSISKAVAGHLSGGRMDTVSLGSFILALLPFHLKVTNVLAQHSTANKYIKNYSFHFDFGQPWGQCDVTMTCVTGHLTNYDFPPAFKNWSSPPPESLFTAPVVNSVYNVCARNQTEHAPL